MSTDFDELTMSITAEQQQIQHNQQERNTRFNKCLADYLNHLEEETLHLESTEVSNDQRNKMISSALENVYDRIMVGSQIGVRKVKETCYEKMMFWDKVIEANSGLKDLELKKDLYLQRQEAKDRYEQAIDNQKIKKISYDVLLGKLRLNHNLKEFQDKNKQLEQQVVKGTKTLEEWRLPKPGNRLPGETSATLNIKPEQTRNAWRPLLTPQQDYDESNFLKHFQFRRQ